MMGRARSGNNFCGLGFENGLKLCTATKSETGKLIENTVQTGGRRRCCLQVFADDVSGHIYLVKSLHAAYHSILLVEKGVI